MNRFLIAYWLFFGVFLHSCQESEVSCTENDISVTDQQLYANFTPTNSSAFELRYSIPELGEVQICNPEILSGIPIEEYVIGINSATLSGCDSCLETLDWFGPGCESTVTLSNETFAFENTVWKLNSVLFQGESYGAPCFSDYQGVFYANDTAVFSLSNQLTVGYEVQDQQLTFVGDAISTLVGVFGYEQFMEDLFIAELFFSRPYQIELSGNQLTLNREDGTQFVFYSE